ncbi:MAG: hypothetical protein QM586_11670 [Xenophilus sp.]
MTTDAIQQERGAFEEWRHTRAPMNHHQRSLAREAFLAGRASMRNHIETALVYLGGKPPDCCDCKWEWGMAIKCLHAALERQEDTA